VQLTATIEDRFRQGLGGAADAPLGLAVSGGGDSMALLHLAMQAGCAVRAATVHHGLRPEAGAEAAMVARACAALGVPHVTLHWHWDGQGNLPDAARRGRLALLSQWAARQGLATVALGHTRDDVAETLLMRLDRKAGVDGLAAMAPRRDAGGIAFLRPLLAVGRQELRDWLIARGIAWADDPTNDDPAYDRARARARLARDGGAEALAALAQGFAALRAGHDDRTAALVRAHVQIDRGDVVIPAAALAAMGGEARRRILQAALLWIGSAEYGPRAAALARFADEIVNGRPAALGGVAARGAKGITRFCREPRAVAATACPAGQVWDGRWCLEGPENNGLTIRALGEAGLRLCPDWRATGLPRLSLLASPAVWQDGALVAAPLAGLAQGWTARTIPPGGVLAQAALSH
jgi:tRNA(Ile)-lysidine synthase